MYYTIYKITNQLDGKIYIGSHKTKRLDDDYMGSGKYLLHAQNKYGIENFTKQILCVFDTAEEMYAKEAELVNEDFLATENTYNLKIGGLGGWDYINNNEILRVPKNRLAMLNTNTSLYIKYGVSNPGQLPKTKETNRKLMLERWKSGDFFVSPPFLGKKHTEETKRTIGYKSSKLQTGSGNSQYGTRWVHSLGLKFSKRIKKEEPLPNGWVEGRKIKF